MLPDGRMLDDCDVIVMDIRMHMLILGTDRRRTIKALSLLPLATSLKRRKNRRMVELMSAASRRGFADLRHD